MESINTGPDTGTLDTRQCARCLADKPLSHFGIHLSEVDGRNRHCFACERQRLRFVKRPAVASRDIRHERASKAVRSALKCGMLTRPSDCFFCHRSDLPIEAHHYMGYEPQFRLTVQWLCKSCHAFANRKRSDRRWWKGWEGAA